MNSITTAPGEFYTTQSSEDWLSRIAIAAYGDPMKYSWIFDANKDVISNPNSVTRGMTLYIPKHKGEPKPIQKSVSIPHSIAAGEAVTNPSVQSSFMTTRNFVIALAAVNALAYYFIFKK